ncbi:MAG TPA: Uma2 family endonuclease [Chthoniobacteraceae bacterium]|jgi:Uma2 family endonuclease|nr:Uma2 family endonuclease [Chthoniobacteraceae bacterium]
MLELLESSPRRRKLARISVEEFHRIDDLGFYSKRAELIRGVVFEKPPMSPLHQHFSKHLYDHLLGLALPGCSVRHESPLTLVDSEPLPDIAVAAGSDADFRARHPTTATLVIEVAVSSERSDREMAALYAEAGVTEYWIVLALRHQVEVYRRPASGEYLERQIFGGEEDLVCTALPAIRVSLSALFA